MAVLFRESQLPKVVTKVGLKMMEVPCSVMRKCYRNHQTATCQILFYFVFVLCLFMLICKSWIDTETPTNAFDHRKFYHKTTCQLLVSIVYFFFFFGAVACFNKKPCCIYCTD